MDEQEVAIDYERWPVYGLPRLTIFPAQNYTYSKIGNLSRFGDTDYIFLSNDRFFSINPHKDNPSAQDGCYVYNEFGINEVERFAFFSKAVYALIKNIFEGKIF